MDVDHYAVLGVPCDASSDDMRSAYKRLAASMRPPELSPAALRNARLGLRQRTRSDSAMEDERRQRWRQVQVAFDTLMNPRRRALFDRSRLSRAQAEERSNQVGERQGPAERTLLDRLPARLDSDESWLTVTTLFQELLVEEIKFEPDHPTTAPEFGNAQSTWEHVRHFYAFWSTYVTKKPFFEAEAHSPEEIAAAANRATRRCMEQENEKLRRMQRSKFLGEFRETVEALRERDPRVAAEKKRSAEEASERVTQRELEEAKKQENIRERRRLARELEQERWAAEEAAPTPSLSSTTSPQISLGSPTLTGTWTCSLCDEKSFQSKQAFEAHLLTKKHKRNARNTPDYAPHQNVEVGFAVSPCILPKSSVEVEDDGSDWLSALLPPPAMESCEPTSALCTTRQSVNYSEITPQLYLFCVALGVEHWCRIFSFLDVVAVASAASGFLSSSVLRESSLGDDGLWQTLATARWRMSGACPEAGPSWLCFIRLAAGTASCKRLYTALGGELSRFCCVAADAADGSSEALLGSFSIWDTTNVHACFASVAFDSPVQSISCENGVVAAASMDSPEIRLVESSDGSLRRLPSLLRRRRGSVCVLSLPLREDVGVIAVAEDTGSVRLEDMSGETDSASNAFELQPIWDVGRQSGVSTRPRGLFWIPGSPALCCSWDAGAALFDAHKPDKPVVSCKVEQLVSALSHDAGFAVFITLQGDVRPWDFRTAPGLALEHSMPGHMTTAAAIDPCNYGVVIASVNSRANCPVLLYRDLRKHAQHTSLPLNGFSVTSTITGLSLGPASDITAVLYDGYDTGCRFASLIGGPQLRLLGTWQSSLDVTALKAATSQKPALVAISRRRGHNSRDSPAELWQLQTRKAAPVVSSPFSKPKPKPKKFFRKSDAGEKEFRATGRRGGGR